MLQKLHSLIYLISVKKKKKKESVNLYQLITPKSFTVCFEVAVRKKILFYGKLDIYDFYENMSTSFM